MNLPANDLSNHPTNTTLVLVIRALQDLVIKGLLVLVIRDLLVLATRFPNNRVVVLSGLTSAPHPLSHTASVIPTSAVSPWLTQDLQAPVVATMGAPHRHHDTETVRVAPANQGVLPQSCTIRLRLLRQSQ